MTRASVFGKHAQSYDASRRQLIPCFDEFYGTASAVLRAHLAGSVRILDVGAGTGLSAAFVLAAFPQAEVLLFDASAEMLDQARVRFQHGGARVAFASGDFAELLPGAEASYDAVVSALAIHHIDHRQKQELFGRIHRVLKPGGLFVNADQVLGASRDIEARYRQVWLEQVRGSGVSDAALAAALERLGEDRMSPLADQLEWLRQAGFREVNCWFKSYSFAVFSGVKRPDIAIGQPQED